MGRSRTPWPAGEVLSDREKARKAVEVLEGILGALVGTSMEELVLRHLPPKVEPLLPPSLLHRIRACCCACEFEGAAEKLDKAIE